jgi:hypothetical protein
LIYSKNEAQSGLILVAVGANYMAEFEYFNFKVAKFER